MCCFHPGSVVRWLFSNLGDYMFLSQLPLFPQLRFKLLNLSKKLVCDGFRKDENVLTYVPLVVMVNIIYLFLNGFVLNVSFLDLCL
ncbi:hypothetical protein YC2023_109344 [Brassica napus]